MSEKIKEIKTTRRLHIFYCDGCGEKLMESEELDDGYFATPDFVDEKIFVSSKHKWYHYRTGYLCDGCTEKENKKLLEKLIEIGFKEEK